MIQDIAPHQLWNQYDRREAPAQDDIALCFRGSSVALLQEGESLHLPSVGFLGAEKAYTYLLTLDNTRFYLYRGNDTLPETLTFVETFRLRGHCGMPKHLIFALLTCKHLSDWYRDNQFCGRCGKPMTHSLRERAMTCSCGYTAYPRIMPAVIVGVTNGDRILLTRYRTGYGHNALIAGFTEIGETAEETVAREVMEEAGIRVKNIRYYKSQPWGIANDLLLGYYCEVDGDDAITMDANELKYAQWVSREDIVLQPDEFSLTNEMMMMFKNGAV